MTLHTIIRRGVLNSIIKSNFVQQSAASSHGAAPTVRDLKLIMIGNREIVGYGLNGEPAYYDRIDFPMPPIRFKENTPDIQLLKDKEKGDWKKLSIEEKKSLYRASFCQTFSEFTAPTGEWKSVIGGTLILVSVALWAYILMKLYVYPPMPHTFDPEIQKAQLKGIIDMRANPIEGVASKWDYEKGKWKE